jgi:hypothetical protein
MEMNPRQRYRSVQQPKGQNTEEEITGTIVFPLVILLQESALPLSLIHLPVSEFTEFRIKHKKKNLFETVKL